LLGCKNVARRYYAKVFINYAAVWVDQMGTKLARAGGKKQRRGETSMMYLRARSDVTWKFRQSWMAYFFYRWQKSTE
jgi:hypothetical protein